MNYATNFTVSFLVFLGIDFLWLTVIAKNLYQNKLGYLLSKNPNFVAAFLFYVIFVIALNYFVLAPALEHKNITKLLVSAALFGFVTYATYDLTNLATIKDWPLDVTIIDLIWGTSLSSAVSFISFQIITRFLHH